MSNSGNEINPQVKMIVETVLERCRKEKDSGTLQIPLENVITRASYYTAMSSVLINQLVESEIIVSTLAQKVNMSTMTAISESLLHFYVTGQYPTVHQIYLNIQNPFVKSMTVDQFASLLVLLGYEHMPTICNNKFLLIEKPKQTFERTLFLKKIHKLQAASVNILYLGERIINASNISEKLWPDYNQKIKFSPIVNNELILYHIVSKTGLKHYLFTNCISSADFNKWLCDIVLPSLEPNTTIVLENNSLHSNIHQNQITEYHSKAEMLAYLVQNNIPCSNNLSKAELFHLVQLCTKSQFYTSLDRLLHAYGHSPLFLPKNFESFSIIEFLWEHIKEIGEIKDEVTVFHVKGYIEDILKNKISRETWKELYDKVLNNQSQMQKLDEKIEEAIEKNFKLKTDTVDKNADLQFNI